DADLRKVVNSKVPDLNQMSFHRALYLVVTPPGVKCSDPVNANVLGYHDSSPWKVNPDEPDTVLGRVPYGWVGVFDNSGGTPSQVERSEIDSFSSTFSHEVAEAITDPYPNTGIAGVQVNKGANWVVPAPAAT